MGSPRRYCNGLFGPITRGLLLAAMLAFPAVAIAQPFLCLSASACPTWVQDIAAVDIPGTLLAGPDGTAFHARMDRENATSQDARAVLRVTRFDVETGAALWSVKVDRFIVPAQMLLATDGAHVLFVGTESVFGVFRAALISFEIADGDVAWSAVGASGTEARASALSPDGGSLAVAGVRGDAFPDAWVSLWNVSTGDLTWQRRLDGGGGLDPRMGRYGTDAVNAVAFDPAGGRIYAAGKLARPGESLYDGLTWALDASNGSDVWRARTGSVAQSQNYAIATDGARVYAAGTEGTYAFDSQTGATLWAPVESLPSCTRPDSYSGLPENCRLLVGPDGSLYWRATYVLLRLDPETGLPLWTHPLRLETVNGHDASVDLDPSGARILVAMAGSTVDTGATRALTEDVEVRVLDTSNGRLLHRGWLDTGHVDRAHVARFAGNQLILTGSLVRVDTSAHHAFLAALPVVPLL